MIIITTIQLSLLSLQQQLLLQESWQQQLSLENNPFILSSPFPGNGFPFFVSLKNCTVGGFFKNNGTDVESLPCN